jgi:hypothetical protein
MKKRGFLKTAGIAIGGLILVLMAQQIFGNQQPIVESTDSQPTETSYNPNSSESDPINVDTRYAKLESLLKAQDFREADEETDKVMLAVANRESEGYLETEDAEKFPCKELRSIDQLWLKYSRGKFGISVQQQIYQSLGGTWESMGDRVGWRQGGSWLSYSDLNFSQTAPLGHLPFLSQVSGGRGSGPGRRFWRKIGELIVEGGALVDYLPYSPNNFLLSRHAECNT